MPGLADPDTVTTLGRLFGAAANAHHEATGGSNPAWPQWYAEFLDGRIDDVLGFSPGADKIAEWLTWADERYRADAPDSPWPYYYAELILDSLEDER